MKTYATIRSNDDANPLLHSNWIAYIDSASDLVRLEGRPGRNPANGKPIVLRPPADTVHFVADEIRLATFGWGPSGYHCINLDFDSANASAALERGRSIAETLGATLTLD